jgi:homoserine kinase
LGLALDIYNTVRVTAHPEDMLLWAEASTVPAPATLGPVDSQGQPTLFFQAAHYAAQQLGLAKPPSMCVEMEAHIPLARGMGSSSTVIVAGLLATIALANVTQPPDLETLCQWAAALEGHPDNVVPALRGGAWLCDESTQGAVATYALPWPAHWHLLLVIPDAPLATEAARAVMPGQVTLPDAVYNLRKTALLVWALCHGNPKAMAEALEDRLHQPYRAPLMPWFLPLSNAARAAGAMGAFISGAGSTVAILHTSDTQARIQAEVLQICQTFAPSSVSFQLLPVSVSTQGAIVRPAPSSPCPDGG